MLKKFPYYHQLDAMDCGPTRLRMVAKHHGKHYSLETLRQKSFIGREGVSMLGISTAAESIGFRTIGVHISFEQLAEVSPRCSSPLLDCSSAKQRRTQTIRNEKLGAAASLRLNGKEKHEKDNVHRKRSL